MRIAIDGLPLCQALTGVGHYTVELARHLALTNPGDEITLVSPRNYLTAPSPEDNLRYIRPTINPILRSWWRSNLPRYLEKEHIDVFHGTNFELPINAPCATVVTIHDLSTLLHPHLHERKNVNRAKVKLPIVSASATLIVTPTETIRREVHEQLDVSLDRIVSVVEAARDCFVPRRFSATAAVRNRLGIGDRFLLYVGTVEPRKNLLSLVQAFEEVYESDDQLQLVITGRTGWLVEETFKYVRTSAARERIVFTGYLPDDDLCSLYSSCSLFFYPSTYEGFGLPPLEAMACGAPVVVSRIPTIEEVVGNSACLVDPEPHAMATTMRELLMNDEARQKLAESGKRRASEFSWAQTARRMREIYLEAMRRFEGRS